MNAYPCLELTSADLLVAQWATPTVSPRVRAWVSTRNGGTSEPPFGRWRNGADESGGLNLGLFCGDDPARVRANRQRLAAFCGARLAWLKQVHGHHVVNAQDALMHHDRDDMSPLHADASVTSQPGVACVVMVADCLPVLLCDADGRAVGAAHAGWRGLAAGIVEQTAQRVAALAGCGMDEIHAYLGPSIGPAAFEVGEEVRAAFVDDARIISINAVQRAATTAAFVPHPQAQHKYLADLPALARLRLQVVGVTQISGGGMCTVTQRERFYSYRRDGAATGRMAAMIWLAQ
jgi:YfiH family protein